MYRYHLAIKGSEAELNWLNHLAQKGWLLQRIHGCWYQFTKTEQTYRLFSEYVTSDVAEELKQSQGAIQILTTVHLAKPDVWICYSGTTAPQLMTSRIDAGDPELQLKIALAMRGSLLNRMNLLLVLSVLLLVALIYFNIGTEDQTSTLALLLIIIIATPAFMASKIHRQSDALRVRTGNYDGAWRPTQHVFLSHMTTELDLEQVKDLGNWTLVGHDQKGYYWYDVETLASLEEIRQTLQPIVGDSVHISVMSYLGFAPIGYL